MLWFLSSDGDDDDEKVNELSLKLLLKEDYQ